MNWELISAIICVAIGGAIGAVLRYLVGHYLGSDSFPWGTFAVNIIGCTLLALLTFSISGQMSGSMKLFIFTGIFGAFTTMSTFTVETVSLFYDDQMVKALENILLNGGACLLGAFIGRYAALLI